MAAYGGLLYLKNLMEPIKLYLARNHISVNNLLETLEKKVDFLQEFLESYSIEGINEKLESDIFDAVAAAEDQIESHIVDHIRARSTETAFKDSFSQVLQKVIDNMDGIQKQARTIKENSTCTNKQPLNSRFTQGMQEEIEERSRLNNTQPTFDDSLIEDFITKLTEGEANRQFIPITGMGGIGKTTLARHLVSNSRIKEHFEISGWITISEEFNLQRALSGLLHDLGVKGNVEADTPITELGTMLHKHLNGKRYLIVADDIWNIEAWDALKIYLPDDHGPRSRVMITSRQSELGDAICPSDTYKMELLDEKKSWSLLQRNVFGQNKCPDALEIIGKRIAESCKGLPLLISVIGGVLSESKEKEYWEVIEKDIKARETSEVYNKLHTSYRYLPIHLKPCFLHLGSFPEDHKIRVSDLEKIWAAEGFLKLREGEIMEDVARINIKALIGRNLIYVDEDMHDHAGNVQYCKIHDLLRDLCLKEAIRHQFLYTTRVDRSDISPDFSKHRRFSLHGNMSKDVDYSHIDDELMSCSFIRSFISTFAIKPKPLFDAKLLRIWSVEESYREEVSSEFVNARYLDFGLIRESPRFPSSISQLWNLQTIKSGYRANTILPCEIWEMSQLRHVNVMMFKLDDPRGGNHKVKLENLQTLSRVVDFKCSKDVAERIPYLRHLKVSYEETTLSAEYLENIVHLTKLESLACSFVHGFPPAVTSKLEFPKLIKELTLELDYLSWEDMGRKIGLLTQLEKFKLYYCDKCSTKEGEEWNMDDDDDDDDDGVQFPKLVYLKIVTKKLKRWIMDSSGPLPNLKHLVLEQMEELKEIPLEIGYLMELRSITLRGCSQTAVESMQKIKDKSSISGNNDLVVKIE